MLTGEHQTAKENVVLISLRPFKAPDDLTVIFDPRHHDEKTVNTFRTVANFFQKKIIPQISLDFKAVTYLVTEKLFALYFFFNGSTDLILVDLGRLILDVSRSRSLDAPHSVGLL
jgi:hypothetical protein